VFAVVYDTCLIAVMIGIEVLGHVPARTATTSPPVEERKGLEHVPTPPSNDATETVEEPDAPVLAPKPRLVAEGKSRVRGVAVYLAECLQPRPGGRVELEECQAAYAASGLRPLTTKEFVESLQHFCSACRIKTKIIGDKVYLMNVQLAPLAVANKPNEKALRPT